MLADKDITNSLMAIKDVIDKWYVAPLQVKRAASTDILLDKFKQVAIENVIFFSNIKEANEFAKNTAEQGDRIIVFGSFHTVANTLSAQ